jgi:serine/threonine protein kinase
MKMTQLVIPGYQILEVVGQGGMATVYRAIQQSLGREVAIKVMHQTMHVPGFAERFLKEAQIIAGFNHPHIIIIHDVGLLNGKVNYLSMEYVKGGDLKQRIQKKINPLVALLYLEQLAECLVYIHQRQVVHRDIKPANVLFRENGTLVLTDFGIAKQLEVDSELTATGSAIGSPHYLSPEQAEGKMVDGRSDIYSLGIMFYEMLTGSKPYQGDSYMATVMMHLSAPIPTLPPAFEKLQPLLNKMMAKDREERFPHAKALLTTVKSIRQKLDSKARFADADADAQEEKPKSTNRYSDWMETMRKAQSHVESQRQEEKSAGTPAAAPTEKNSEKSILEKKPYIEAVVEKTVTSSVFSAVDGNPASRGSQKPEKKSAPKHQRRFWWLLLGLLLSAAVLVIAWQIVSHNPSTPTQYPY